MAIIGKIQKNSVLLLIVIGGAMLAFIFSDLRPGSGEREYVPLGTIYGEDIDEDEYEDLREVYVNRDLNTAISQNNNQPLAEEKKNQTIQAAEDKAFNETVRRSLMNREFEKLGLTCTPRELNDMLHGEHIHPWVQQIPMFSGSDGQVSRDSVRKYINLLSAENEPADEQQRQAWIEQRDQWKAFEDELKDTRKADKYVTLIKKGLFVNTLEAKHEYYAENEVRKVRFVVQKYSDIPKDEVEVTDEDIKAYYEEHKNEKQYEMVESRDLDYLTFSIEPSEADIAGIKTEMTTLKEKFANTEENMNFMLSNSDYPWPTDSMELSTGTESLRQGNQFQGPGEYPAVADDALQEAEIGDVVGPFPAKLVPENVSVVFIAKVTGKRVEKQAWVRHILIKVDATRTEEEAKAKADSVIAVINEKDNFVEMVNEISEDPGSLATNGEYKWFPEGRMVPEFNDASFNGAIGQLQLVKTQFGYHIIEVLGRADRVIPKVAVVAKKVEPSEETLQNVEEMVYDFIYNVNESMNAGNDSAFYTMAADSNLSVMNSRVWINQNYITGIKNPKKVMSFAFNKNRIEGDISDPILDGSSYVVVYLTNIIEKGVPQFEDVKEQMRFPALKDKQASVYMEKMGGKSSLEEVAQTISNGQILNASITFGANVIAGGGGNEPDVIGALFREELAEGFMTVPIQGRSGVYVCILDEIQKAPETTDYTAQRDYIKTTRTGSADNLVIRALREAADVEDNRRKREYQ